MPATFAACHAAFAEASENLPESAPASMLDLGSGPGTAMWAGAEVWPSIARFVLIEQSSAFVQLGKERSLGAAPALERAEWRHGTVAPARIDVSVDLVTMSYLLCELEAEVRARLLREAWDAASEMLVLVEPGTTEGFQRISEARGLLLEWGANLLAPCPHSAACPIVHPDWCHFATRVSRSRAHQIVKAGSVGYEDEPYTYLAAARRPRSAKGDRILRPPRVSKASVCIDLCTDGRVRELDIARRDAARYKRARKARWGERFDGG